MANIIQEPVEASLLKQKINQHGIVCPDVQHFIVLDSTNDYLTQQQGLPNGAVCIAESQTAGKGQQGRRWISPRSGNLYLSILWRYPMGVHLTCLPLWSSLALANALTALGYADVQIKWPNDLVVDGRKLAGVLVESASKKKRITTVVGIGLNIAMSDAQGAEIDRTWCDLASVASANTHSNLDIITYIVRQMISMLQRFPLLAGLPQLWSKFDYYQHKIVQFQSHGDIIEGYGCGVTQFGGYRVKTAQHCHTLNIGDARLLVT